MRGEKGRARLSPGARCGSSPRAWGKGRRRGGSETTPRIIPTCVGKRLLRLLPHQLPSDHPHVRGEKMRPPARRRNGNGSSPRAWGKDAAARAKAERERIIPTCVGKRLLAVIFMSLFPDHPHVRGEKYIRFEIYDAAAGSSPRAWGKVLRIIYYHLHTRIIPTCVGKSGGCAGRAPGTADHPHVRGEKGRAGYTHTSTRGSSPRAWGKGAVCWARGTMPRIIPTCVGKRHGGCCTEEKSADHPHVRGEKAVCHSRLPFKNGSSPRAWGKGRRCARTFRGMRIIPTCVGKRYIV